MIEEIMQIQVDPDWAPCSMGEDVLMLPGSVKASPLDCVLQFGVDHWFLILLVFASIIAMLIARSLAEDDSTDLPDSRDWKSGF